MPLKIPINKLHAFTMPKSLYKGARKVDSAIFGKI